MNSHLVDVDEEAFGFRLRVDDPAFGPLFFQELLEFAPLLLKGGADRRLVQLHNTNGFSDLALIACSVTPCYSVTSGSRGAGEDRS